MWTGDENKIKLVLIRHGQVQGNVEKRYIGSTDEHLTVLGRTHLASRTYPEVARVFSSPLNRCIETARIIYPDMEPELISDFREMNFGLFEGKNYNDLKDDRRYQNWIDSNGMDAFPEGEDVASFTQRVMEALGEILIDLAGFKGQVTKAALVVHGGTIMAILSGLGLNSFFDKMLGNGDYTEITIIHDGSRIISVSNG